MSVEVARTAPKEPVGGSAPPSEPMMISWEESRSFEMISSQEKPFWSCTLHRRSSGRVWIYVGDGRERKVIGMLLHVDWDGSGRETEDFGAWANFKFRIPLAAALAMSVDGVLGRRKVVRGQ
eukprot:scaffold5406_cov114-Cylindrotheca_fusiformis.AAC.1